MKIKLAALAALCLTVCLICPARRPRYAGGPCRGYAPDR